MKYITKKKKIDITHLTLFEVELLLSGVENYTYKKIKDKHYVLYDTYTYVVEIIDAFFENENIVEIPKTITIESKKKLTNEELKEKVMIQLENEVGYDYNDWQEVICSDVLYVIK